MTDKGKRHFYFFTCYIIVLGLVTRCLSNIPALFSNSLGMIDSVFLYVRGLTNTERGVWYVGTVVVLFSL